MAPHSVSEVFLGLKERWSRLGRLPDNLTELLAVFSPGCWSVLRFKSENCLQKTVEDWGSSLSTFWQFWSCPRPPEQRGSTGIGWLNFGDLLSCCWTLRLLFCYFCVVLELRVSLPHASPRTVNICRQCVWKLQFYTERSFCSDSERLQCLQVG